MSAGLETTDLDIAVAGRTLCRALALQVRAGEFWAVLGRNGSGKSTLLHSLAGLRACQGGTVRLFGKPLAGMPRRWVAQRLGLLPQHHSDPFPASVLETALIGRHPHLRPWQDESPDDLRRARAALAAMDLDGLEARPVATLSGGERRRLALATLLTQDPTLMLLDEPTDNLDVAHQVQVLTHFRNLARSGYSPIAVLHEPGLALRFCSHALLLYGDGEWCAGPAADLLLPAPLTRLYGHPVLRVDGPAGPTLVPG